MHTPGPWQASGVRQHMSPGGAQQWLVVTDTDGRGFAYIPYSDRTPADHIASHADQRLIAAAPELLAALKRAVSIADVNLKEKFSGRTDECAQAYHACIEAIAKAEGKP